MPTSSCLRTTKHREYQVHSVGTRNGLGRIARASGFETRNRGLDSPRALLWEVPRCQNQPQGPVRCVPCRGSPPPAMCAWLALFSIPGPFPLALILLFPPTLKKVPWAGSVPALLQEGKEVSRTAQGRDRLGVPRRGRAMDHGAQSRAAFHPAS